MTHPGIQKKLYLDDIVVGLEFQSSQHQLDTEQIIAFGKQFDPQPFHTDVDAARDTFFEGLAASGWHTMAITMKLLVESVPFARGIIGAGGEISWPRPTRPGDILRVKSKVLDVKPSRSKPDQGMVILHCRTFNQHDDTLQDFTPKLLAFRKADA